MNPVMFEALKRTLGDEGGYSNHGADRGGETYRGISRKNWPGWEGWKIIDRANTGIASIGAFASPRSMDQLLEKDDRLDSLVESFYRANFWPAWMDKLPGALAVEVFDAGVNHGVGTAARMLQHTANLLNQNGGITPDIAEDGKPGPATLAALDAVMKRRGLDLVMKCFKLLRGRLFIELCERDREQEVFLAGWLNNRVRL